MKEITTSMGRIMRLRERNRIGGAPNAMNIHIESKKPMRVVELNRRGPALRNGVVLPWRDINEPILETTLVVRETRSQLCLFGALSRHFERASTARDSAFGSVLASPTGNRKAVVNSI